MLTVIAGFQEGAPSAFDRIRWIRKVWQTAHRQVCCHHELKTALGLEVEYQPSCTLRRSRHHQCSALQFDASARSIQRKLFLNYLLMTVHIVFLSALYWRTQITISVSTIDVWAVDTTNTFFWVLASAESHGLCRERGRLLANIIDHPARLVRLWW